MTSIEDYSRWEKLVRGWGTGFTISTDVPREELRRVSAMTEHKGKWQPKSTDVHREEIGRIFEMTVEANKRHQAVNLLVELGYNRPKVLDWVNDPSNKLPDEPPVGAMVWVLPTKSQEARAYYHEGGYWQRIGFGVWSWDEIVQSGIARIKVFNTPDKDIAL